MENLTCDCNIIHEEIVNNIKSVMPKNDTFESLSEFLKILSDKTRVKILWLLNENELCVCDIAVLCNMTKSAISHQLNTLRSANFIKYRKEGKVVYYTLKDTHVKFMLENSIKHIEEKD